MTIKRKLALIFVLLIVLCMDLSIATDESLVDEETQSWSWLWHPWPPIRWWRLPPWWLQPLHPPPPPPPEPRQKTPNHPHRPPPRRHAPPGDDMKNPPPPPDKIPAIPPPAPAGDPSDCSTALIYVDGCVKDLITSFFEDKVRVGRRCCRVISGISDDCFREAFTQFKAPGFVGKVRGFCSNKHSH